MCASQATYSNDRCREIGNEPLMKAFAEMLKYENALDIDHSEDDRDAINYRVRHGMWCRQHVSVLKRV